MHEIMNELKAEIIKEIGVANLAKSLAPKIKKQIESEILKEMNDFCFHDITSVIVESVENELAKHIAQIIKNGLKK